MTLKIGLNIDALRAQRRLQETGQALSKTFERLSSGVRVNTASDDAAGLAISQSLRFSARIHSQAIRNINDGLSYLTIADSAVNQMKGIVTRMKELASQAANGTFSDNQRTALDNEVQALSAEYNRILETTSFNQRDIFSREASRFTLQIGDGPGSSLECDLTAGSGEADILQGNTIRMVGLNYLGQQLNSDFIAYGINGDGSAISFSTVDANVIANDTNALEDVFVFNPVTGTVVRGSESSLGAQGGNFSTEAWLSPDGRYLAFQSRAPNLVPSDGDGTNDVFIKDLSTGQTVRVSELGGGLDATSHSEGLSISADGRYALFTTRADNLAVGTTIGRFNIVLRDMTTGAFQLISEDSGGVEGNNNSRGGVISEDGQWAVFRSEASNLVAGDLAGQRDIFIRDLNTWEIRRVTETNTGVESNSATDYFDVSSDGRYVVFSNSSTNLISESDTNGTSDVFIRDMLTGEISRVSENSQGVQANGQSRAVSISADGRFVVFESMASNLDSTDTNGTWDVFVKDLLTGDLNRVSTEGNGASTNGQISSDGRFILFKSLASNLAENDSNGTYDLFLAANPLYPDPYIISEMTGISVSTIPEALSSLSTLDSCSDELMAMHSATGSLMSRLNVAAANLSVSRENAEAAFSRIVDADIAAETSNLVRLKILQSAGAAVLTQANVQPALALTLLQSDK